MKKLILPAALAAALVFLPLRAFAANLEISSSSDFSNQTDEFTSGQTIYARITTQVTGDKKHDLNLRDSSYNLLVTYPLAKSGNQFTTSLKAPNETGYYSLETQIESASSNSTSVKTIKVGSPREASIDVRINNSTSGQSKKIAKIKSPQITPSPEVTPAPTPTASPGGQLEKDSNIFKNFSNFLKKFFTAIWPF